MLAAVAVVAAALALWSMWIEPASLRVATYRLGLPHWPAECSGVTVAAISDLHVGSPFNGVGKLERVVEALRTAHPDLVLLGGDYVIDNVLGGRFVSPEISAKKLAEIDAPLGVLAVLGNHDWWLGAGRVRAALEGSGIPVLEDSAVEVRRGPCAFWIAGVGDFREGRHDVAAALRQVPAGAPVVVLTHNPDVFPDVPDRVSLTVAGHTHGGQVRIPFVGRPIVPSRYGERYAFGSVVEDGRHLFVTPGIGTSIVPIRFLVPPEISLLTLTPAGP
ncbi:MAG TPA: metallophosphoesterase [Gammaproteobacteria bacterium]|nr:metallophosphoesterase [Gammaproteobacteria bacterium]